MPSACPEKSRGAPTGALMSGDTSDAVVDSVPLEERDGERDDERDDEGDDAVDAISSHRGTGRFSTGVSASNAASDAAHNIRTCAHHHLYEWEGHIH